MSGIGQGGQTLKDERVHSWQDRAPRGVQNIVDTTCKRISLKSVNQPGRHCSEAQTVSVFLCHRLAFVVLAFLLYYFMCTLICAGSRCKCLHPNHLFSLQRRETAYWNSAWCDQCHVAVFVIVINLLCSGSLLSSSTHYAYIALMCFLGRREIVGHSQRELSGWMFETALISFWCQKENYKNVHKKIIN